jgi:hypothetical protein
MDESDKPDADDLARMARAADDATFGDGDTPRARMPGTLSGDFGPKGIVSARHRELSRTERAARSEVPRGTVEPGGMSYLLLPMIAIALVLLVLVALLGWLAS